MGRRGWGGRPPADDADARARIIAAAIRMVERRGPQRTTLSDVAVDLGVTRPTVYRHFATTDELLTAAADVALGGWTKRIGELTAEMDDPADLLVEAVAYLVEQLPAEPLLALLLDTDQSRSISRGMVTSEAVARSRIMLEHTAIKWSDWGYRGAALDELVEYLLRLIHSMVLAPPDPPRTPRALRSYLRQWIAPALDARRSASATRRRGGRLS